MHSKLYIPKKIKVGFVNRDDTYTGKLGFVIYYDEQGELKQLKSWDGWRDHKIEPQEFDNVPRSNFIFNKDVKRYGHWSSHSKVRIYDSRDFEFEIDFSNMMYILMHSDVSKRDIQEECVFAWSGKNIFLLPVNSQEYIDAMEFTLKQGLSLSFKDLVAGHTYSTKKGADYIYLGHFDWADKNYSENKWVGQGKKHIFYNTVKPSYGERYHLLEAKDLAACISSEVVEDYALIVENYMKTPHCQKTGSFSIKKGFDKVGYKKTAWYNFKVTIDEKNFSVDEVDFLEKQGVKSIKVNKKNRNSYSYYNGQSALEREYIKKMQKEGIDCDNMVAVKEYFLKAGFGQVVYVDVDKKKTIISKEE